MTKMLGKKENRQRVSMSLTSAYQLVPEQATAAIVIHHPAASYFNTGESRLEQLIKV